jgi:hypothetical protein
MVALVPGMGRTSTASIGAKNIPSIFGGFSESPDRIVFRLFCGERVCSLFIFFCAYPLTASPGEDLELIFLLFLFQDREIFSFFNIFGG